MSFFNETKLGFVDKNLGDLAWLNVMLPFEFLDNFIEPDNSFDSQLLHLCCMMSPHPHPCKHRSRQQQAGHATPAASSAFGSMQRTRARHHANEERDSPRR